MDDYTEEWLERAKYVLIDSAKSSLDTHKNLLNLGPEISYARNV